MSARRGVGAGGEFWVVVVDDQQSGGPEGATRIWRWWRREAEAAPRCREEFEDLPSDVQARLYENIRRYLAGESRRQDVDHLGGGIFEIRYRKGNNHYRVLFMKWGHVSVGLTAFYKNTRATPTPALRRAKQRAKQWTDTFGAQPPTAS